MVSFTDICIFVLATTKHHQFISVWNSRVEPIVQTWGSLMPSDSLTFIFVFDQKFLHHNCSISSSSSSSSNHHRMLKAHTPQTSPVNTIDFYKCPISNSNQIATVAWSGNCTGEYFGIGPTCRCQEAIRYFYYNSYNDKKAKKNWFIFIDDDIYIRPYALLSFLDEYDNRYGVNEPAAFLPSSYMMRGFKFSNRWNKNKHRCDEHEFNLAQPIIMNRAAVQLLHSAIDANGLVRLQHIWGGTHDAVLGLLLWIYNIPTYSIHDFFWPDQILKEGMIAAKSNPQLQTTIIYHRIRNMKLSMGANNFHHAISQHDMAILLNETSINYKDKDFHKLLETIQRRVGSFSIQRISRLKNSTVDKTIFHDKANLLSEVYFDFHPTDCDLKDSIPTF